MLSENLKKENFKLFSIDDSNLENGIQLKIPEITLEELKSNDSKPENAVIPSMLVLNDCKVTLDIDAIIGPLTFENFWQSMMHPVDINLSGGRIQTKNYFVVKDKKAIDIQSIKHIQLGTVNLPAGKASLYYICPGLDESTEYSVLERYLLETIEKSKIQNLNVNNILTKVSIPAFVEVLIAQASNTKNHKHDFLFIESFGNKFNILTEGLDSEKELLEMIKMNFDIEYFPHMQIDLAFQVVKDEMVIFPEYKLFKNFNLKPNYFLFLNKNFANCHGMNISSDESSIEYSSNLFLKHNFYSTIEDLLVPIKNYAHTPLITNELMKSSLAEHRPVCSNKKMNSYLHSLSSVVDSLNRSKSESWAYRFELRIYLKKINEMIKTIGKELIETSFLGYKSVDFFKKACSTAKNILKEIDVTKFIDIERLFNYCFVENFLVHAYFKGCKNLQACPKKLHRFASSCFSSDNRFQDFILDIDFALEDISRSEMFVTLDKNIIYDSSLDESKKLYLRNIISSCKIENINEFADMILKQYCIDIGIRYNTEKKDFSVLKSFTYEDSSSFKKKNIDLLIAYQFSPSNNAYWRKLPFRCMLTLYLHEKNINLQDFLNSIKKTINDNEIDLLFNIANNLRRPENILLKLFNRSGNEVNTN